MRYRLQQKERVSLKNLIGNVIYPTPTYRWEDIAVSDNIEVLNGMLEGLNKGIGKKYHIEYKIEDTLMEGNTA